MRAYSLDLRQRILDAYRAGEGTQPELARRFRVSLSFVEKLLHQHRTSGSIAPRPHGGGQRRRIDPEHEPVLLRLIDARNDATDAEMAALFAAETGLVVSPRTVNRMWHRLGVTHKKRR
jgi:transposase